jgi:hypothetical protein
MGNRLSPRPTANKFAVVVSCAAAFVWSGSRAFATTIPLPTDESVAVVGAFDVVDASSATGTGSHKPGYYGVANNSSPTAGPRFSGTPATGGLRPAKAAAGQEDPFDVLADGQLVEALATQGLMSPDALASANLERLGQAPGVYRAASSPVNAGGAATVGSPGDPEAALAFQIPEPITSLSPSVVVVDVGPVEDGGGLHWNASDPAAPGTSAAFAGNILTNTDVPIDNTTGNAPAASGGGSIGVLANEVAAVPEPAPLVLLGGGLMSAGARQWKRRRHA